MEKSYFILKIIFAIFVGLVAFLGFCVSKSYTRGILSDYLRVLHSYFLLTHCVIRFYARIIPI